MAAIAISMGVVFFFIGFFAIKIPFIKMLIFSIGIIVANVPEGLLPQLTVSLRLTGSVSFPFSKPQTPDNLLSDEDEGHQRARQELRDDRDSGKHHVHRQRQDRHFDHEQDDGQPLLLQQQDLQHRWRCTCER